MLIRAQTIVCAVRAHGEHGAIVRGLTAEHGLLAGYVRGGRSRRLRPILSAGNIVEAEFRARTEDQLAALTVELVTSRAALLTEPMAAAALDWATALAAATLPEGHPYPRIYAALDGVIAAIEAASVARDWANGLARYELLVLAELGFGSDNVAGDDGLLARLKDNGERLSADLFAGRRVDVMAARERLIDRLTRAVG
ncbi:DNA repair protein RecO [Sphingomonas paeninsulae]|uniref:DNA repair protein RecO n=1 Tax=Sphingomonas paeninsulae TaxID=2319844 RepID=A0A494TP06_SPHPE|nr:recombination protein O N-terminal domain-containing protein [Sphingomonas paeninsulae]AYJ87208.1 DNA repair protein RecO [Sphingomonas paeninsulae]